jgi:HAD superfamily hydrolase (TIGR01484 family)
MGKASSNETLPSTSLRSAQDACLALEVILLRTLSTLADAPLSVTNRKSAIENWKLEIDGAHLSNNIRLVVIDIDGCLTPGEAQPWDFLVLQFVAELNRKARADARRFAVTLCTGRQEPYVEAMMQAIDAHAPGIYENGGGLYSPAQYRFAENPAIDAGKREKIAKVREILAKEIVETGMGQFQPGKEVSLTLYPARAGVTIPQLGDWARLALDGKVSGLTVMSLVTSVDIVLDGIDKGAGVEWLSRETGIPLAQMAGIGDSSGDLPYLRRVGFAAAPANATDDVKRAVQYVSPFEDGKGVVDILSRWVNL